MNNIYPGGQEHWAAFEDESNIIEVFKHGTPEDREVLAEYAHWIFELLPLDRRVLMWLSIDDWNGPYSGEFSITQEELDAFADEFGFEKVWYQWQHTPGEKRPAIASRNTLLEERT